MSEVKLTFFSRNGEKILIAPDIDTHFGAINHKWKLDNKDTEWVSFHPRVSLHEITLSFLSNYFDQSISPVSKEDTATIYIQEKKRLVFFDTGKKSSMLRRVSHFDKCDDIYYVVIDGHQRIIAQKEVPVTYT